MKKFFIIINLIVAFVLCTGLTINGGISYNVNSARKISFDNIQNKIDTKEYSLYFYDKNYKSNIKAKYKNKNKFINRYVTFFSDGCYGIIYKRDKNTGYYYSAKGILEYIEISYSKNFPKKFVKYNIDGNIDTVSLWVSSREQFIFDKNKLLIAHWINENKYNANGKLIDKRN